MAVNNEKYSDADLNIILKEFKIPISKFSFQPLTSGYINDTFLVFSDNKPSHILQRINHSVFENVEGLMLNTNQALKQLKSDDYQRIQLIPADSGKLYCNTLSGYWRVMTYITNSITYDFTTEPKTAFEAGRIIGKFHVLLIDEDLQKYVETIPKFHDLELRKMQFLAALARASKERKTKANGAVIVAKKLLKKLEDTEIQNLPQRICHNDTKLNNILFSEETQKALCLIDLDTIMNGYFHYDFGDAIRTIVNTAPEDESNHSKITFEKQLFEAFVDGLASNDSFLSSEEIQALPFGVVLMPFLHGIRALSDYLNGNIYYKVDYENQNLDRCLSLFDFTKKAFANLDYMKSILEIKLSSEK